jgi:Ser/Thr protein kinase RdoA (MazF antagonist)
MRYEDRTVRGQVALLRPTAREVLRQYPIEVASLRVLDHAFNTTFRVDTTDGRRFALRLNVNSRRTDAFIGAEMAWLAALSEETDLWVATPQRTREGALLAHVHCGALGRELPAALFAWLPGRDLGTEATARQMRAVGRAAAQLHAHGERWRPPPGTELPVIDHPMMDSEYVLDRDHPLLSTADHAFIDEVLAHAQRPLRRRCSPGSSASRCTPTCTAGTCGGTEGRLAVFDFDDSGIGCAGAGSGRSRAYYVRDNFAQEAALLEGYQELRPLPAVHHRPVRGDGGHPQPGPAQRPGHHLERRVHRDAAALSPQRADQVACLHDHWRLPPRRARPHPAAGLIRITPRSPE